MPTVSRGPRPLLVAMAAVALCSAPGPGFAGRSQEQRPPQADAGPTLVVENVLLREVLKLNADALGGEAVLDALRAVRFSVAPSTLGPDGEWTEVPPIGLAFERRGEFRVRFDDRQDGRALVKVGRPSSMRVFVDGQPTALPELLTGARYEALALTELVELWIGMTSGRLQVADEGRRRRDGRDVHAMRVRLQGEGTGRLMQAYLDCESGLATRLDVFDPRTGMRRETARFLGWSAETGPRLPATVEFSDREGVVRMRWQIRDVAFDPELPDGYFERP